MVKYTSKSKWFSLQLPKHWVVEENETCTTFYKKEGVGALQISAYDTGEPQSAKESIIEYLADEGIEDKVEISLSEIRQQKVAFCSYSQGKDYYKVWVIVRGKFLVLITYVCEVSLKSSEAEAAENIVESLEIIK